MTTPTPLTRASTGGRSFTCYVTSYDPGAVLSAPATGPTIGQAGTPGTTDYWYGVTFQTTYGETALGVVTETMTGAATLNGTNYNTLSAIPTGPTGTTGRKVYRSSTGATSGFGLIDTIADNVATTFNDQGAVAGAAPPSANTTGGDPNGTPTRTEFLPGKGNTLTEKVGRLKDKVASNTRFANRIDEPEISTVEGAMSYLLNATLGLDPLWWMLGGKATLSAIHVQTTANVVTANGVSTLTFAAGAGFTKGLPVLVNTTSGGVESASTEPAPIQSYTEGGGVGTLVVNALTINAAATTGIYVTQPALTNYANSLLSAGALGDLPRAVIERNIVGNWAELFPNVFAEKGDFTFSQHAVETQIGLYGTAKMTYLNADGSGDAAGTFTSYNPSTSDEEIALQPFTALNASLAFADDPFGTGTSSVQAALGVLDAKISFDNALKKFDVLGNPVMQAIPGDEVKCEISYNEVETSHRPAILYDYVRVSKGASFHILYAKNFGTLTTPVHHGVCFYLPFAKFEDPQITDAVGDLGKWAHKATGMVLRGQEQDLLRISAF